MPIAEHKRHFKIFHVEKSLEYDEGLIIDKSKQVVNISLLFITRHMKVVKKEKY